MYTHTNNAVVVMVVIVPLINRAVYIHTYIHIHMHTHTNDDTYICAHIQMTLNLVVVVILPLLNRAVYIHTYIHIHITHTDDAQSSGGHHPVHDQ